MSIALCALLSLGKAAVADPFVIKFVSTKACYVSIQSHVGREKFDACVAVEIIQAEIYVGRSLWAMRFGKQTTHANTSPYAWPFY